MNTKPDFSFQLISQLNPPIVGSMLAHIKSSYRPLPLPDLAGITGRLPQLPAINSIVTANAEVGKLAARLISPPIGLDIDRFEIDYPRINPNIHKLLEQR
ncbi:hypothetical protein IC229_26260 [Spirosoma sp. BT702]|uniref:Uncharacterized protein n=1 Tax=Spirosoma profusum TaxID=2771354 RepID=A0A927ATR0_9BACT|nr:hypothetical protein [Spirosoma profusum]MBD2704175.1 hypothetical protein [Spirosoma profusum]